jgi:cyclic pyranopterin phosphate synthase
MDKAKLSHIDEQGRANMVDVGDKPDQVRIARATGRILLTQKALQLIKDHALKKGDVITVAEIAGIQAAKNTPSLIPLCHSLMLSKVEVRANIEEDGVSVHSMVKTVGKTGVEMEALTAVSIALLTVYDMTKAVDKNIRIDGVRLLEKSKTDL